MSEESKFDERMITLAIASGLVDHLLDDIVSAVQRRRSLLATEKLSVIQIGDRITISANVKPKLLAGCPCEVVGFDGEKIKVRLLASRSDKWRNGNTITISKGLIGDTPR